MPKDTRDYFGWERVAKPQRGDHRMFAALPEGGVVEFRKGDPDAGGLRVLVGMVKGGDGPDALEPADPDLILSYAQREIVLEELRQDGVDLAGNNDEMTRKAVGALIRKGERTKAEVVARYRSEQIARTRARADAMAVERMLTEAEGGQE